MFVGFPCEAIVPFSKKNAGRTWGTAVPASIEDWLQHFKERPLEGEASALEYLSGLNPQKACEKKKKAHQVPVVLSLVAGEQLVSFNAGAAPSFGTVGFSWLHAGRFVAKVWRPSYHDFGHSPRRFHGSSPIGLNGAEFSTGVLAASIARGRVHRAASL